MSEISVEISEEGPTMADPDQIRVTIQSRIEQLLQDAPGLSIKGKVRHLADRLGIPPRRIDEYRYGLVSMRTVEECQVVTNYALRRADAEKRAAGIRQKIQGTLDAYARQTADRDSYFEAGEVEDGQGVSEARSRAGLCGAYGALGALALAGEGLGRFTTRILECRAIPLEAATERYRSLLSAIDGTAGEFTDSVADDMRATGLDRRSWLYRAEPAFPVLHVGQDIPIVSAEDRERILFRPLREQPLAPTFLSTILDQFGDVLRHSRPTLHRITATFGGEPITYDRLTNHFPASNLFMSCCLPVAS
jgi:hypothetical protein